MRRNQSAVNRVQIGRASVGHRTGVDRWFFKSADSLKLTGNLLIMEHTSVYFKGHRAMVCPFQSVDRCPADAHDVRAGTARLPVDASRIEKNLANIGKNLTWPEGAPVAMGDADDRPTTPIILRSSAENVTFRPKTHRIGIGAFMWQGYYINFIRVRVARYM